MADLFPLLGDEDLQELANSIGEEGLLNAIVLDAHGHVLDGRKPLRRPQRDPLRAAGGRRRYHRLRQDQAAIRRLRVAELLRDYGCFAKGVQARIAKEVGVSKSTISSDFARIFSAPLGAKRCPTCGSIKFPEIDDDELKGSG